MRRISSLPASAFRMQPGPEPAAAAALLEGVSRGDGGASLISRNFLAGAPGVVMPLERVDVAWMSRRCGR
jgi:hypothetical protein